MVGSIHFFDLSAKQADWLSVRQKTVAGNIANANTPGYQMRDVKAFSKLVDTTPMDMTVTNAAHMNVEDPDIVAHALYPEKTTETTHSGNNVNLEEEVNKGGEIGREMAMNTALVKVFHRMLLATVKGGA